MVDNYDNIEGPGPHEAYGLQRVPKSRNEAIRSIKEELHREIARRSGTYGRRLAELFEAIEEARKVFEADFEALIENDRQWPGPQAASRSWHELVAQIDNAPPGLGATLAERVRDVERSAERHEGLRAEATTVRHHLTIHREAMGFLRHALVEEKFPLPDALPPIEVAWRQAREKLKETKPQATTEHSPVV